MQKKNIIIDVIVIIIVGTVAFYGGMQYTASKTAQAQLTQGGRSGGFGGGVNGGQRGAGQGGQGGGQRGSANGGAGDFVSGQIVSKDDTSVTIKTRDGGSKIVFFSGSTTIDKSVSGASSDLSAGQQVTANGKSNPDGSLAAQNIQIRPAQGPGQN